MPGKQERGTNSVSGRAEMLNMASMGVPVSDAPITKLTRAVQPNTYRPNKVTHHGSYQL